MIINKKEDSFLNDFEASILYQDYNILNESNCVVKINNKLPYANFIFINFIFIEKTDFSRDMRR